jgi:hypothetical protein
MPKSRLRGGKKAHRKRVQKRNQNIQSQQNRIQKIWEEEMIKRMEELKNFRRNSNRRRDYNRTTFGH